MPWYNEQYGTWMQGSPPNSINIKKHTAAVMTTAVSTAFALDAFGNASPIRSGQLRGGKKYKPTKQPDAPRKKRTEAGSFKKITPDPQAQHRKFAIYNMPAEKYKIKNVADDHEVAIMPMPKRVAKIAPDYATINLPYFNTFMHTTTGVNFATQVIRLNSCFDPSFTFASVHQPYGRDKYVSFGYKFYRVLNADVTIRFIQAGNSSTQLINNHTFCGYELTDDSADLFSDYRRMVEGKHSKTELLLSPNLNFAGTGGHAIEMNYHYDPNHWDFHVQGEDTDQRWTPIGNNPLVNQFLAIHTGAAHGGISPDDVGWATAVRLFVHVNYTVQFREQTYIKSGVDTTSGPTGEPA